MTRLISMSICKLNFHYQMGTAYKSLICSFVDQDMLMQHFGHSVGHLQYEKQHEMNLESGIDLESDDNNEDNSHALDNEDCEEIQGLGGSDGELNDGHDSEAGAESEMMGDSDNSDSDLGDTGYESF